MNKNYYKKLSHKYFEATLSRREERRLKAFLAVTDDPDFDDIKAVAGYFAAGQPAQAVRPVRWKWIPVTAVSAAAAILLVAGVHIGRKERIHNDEDIASMERTLASIFSAGTDIETELSGLLDQ